MLEDEIRNVLADIWAINSTDTLLPGRLGTETGTVAEIDVVGRPGYVYVSMGSSGDQGITIAKDRVGVAKIVFLEIKMRRELGELVIREAAAYAGGSGSGGGGGSDTLAGLSDVQLTSPASGNALQYNGTKWINVIPAGGSGGAPSPHGLSSTHHDPDISKLNWDWINYSGSSLSHIVTRNHSQLNGVSPDQHHPHVHPLVGIDALGVTPHTASGLTTGQVIRATGATTFTWDTVKHTEIDPSTITADQHHNQQHDITGDDHTIVGAPFDVVGAIGTNNLGLITPTHDPGASERLLKTSSNGSLTIDTTLLVVDAPTSKVTIDTLLYADAANHWVGINRSPAGAALDIVASANADHTQRIKQKAGQLGRMWRIEDLDGNELIVLDSVGNLQSGRPGFYSGLTGWQITPQGNAEFNNIWARGELHATVFVKDEVHATGGTFMVATAGKLHADAIIDAGTTDEDVFEVESTAAAFPGVVSMALTIESTVTDFGTTLTTQGVGNVIEIDDPPSGPGFYFQPGEILRVKTEVNEEGNPLKLADLWLEVMSATQGDGYSSYSVTKRSGSDCTIPAGSAIVSYGQRGDGRILMTSDWRSDEGYTPYIDVFTTGENPWTGDAGDIIPRMRMGQLKGVGVPGTTVPGPGDGIIGVTGVPQWGMIAGTDLTNANTSYFIASNLGIRMVKVPLTFNNGVSDTGSWTADGNLRVGKNVASDATTGFRVITTSGAGDEGNVIIGNTATGNFLRWNQASGILTVSGSLLVTDPGGTVTKTYVDEQDASYNLLAQGYGSTAETNSTAYVNNRKVVKITGTWTSPTAHVIQWASVVLHLANGTTRSITNGLTTAIPAGERKFLYVKWVTGTGALAMIPKTNSETITDPDYILIAVCDPGSPKASVAVVGGSTYISGGNIFTQSIVATNIAAGTITANEIAGTTITGAKLALGAVDTNQLADGAVTYAKADAGLFVAMGGYRVMAISGKFYSTASNVIGWDQLTILKADSSAGVTVLEGTTSPVMTERNFFYIANDATGTVTMQRIGASTMGSLPANSLVLAVGDLGPVSGKASITVVAGGTVISGDNIATGSVTADRMNVSSLSAIDTNTGSLTVTGNITVGTAGKIYSGTKSTYASTTAGFFLGYESGYKFSIGDGDNYLKWNGTSIELKTKIALELRAENIYGRVLELTDVNGENAIEMFYGFVNTFPQLSFRGVIDTNYVNLDGSLAFFDSNYAASKDLIHFRFGIVESYWSKLTYAGATGLLTYSHAFSVPTLYITGASSPASGSAGSPGEISWDGSYIYVCVAANTWRRATLSAY